MHERYREVKSVLLASFPLEVIIHPKRVQKKIANAKEKNHEHLMHAKNCITLEVLPSLELINERHPVGIDGRRKVHFSEKFKKHYLNHNQM